MQNNETLIQSLIKDGYLRSSRIIDVFRKNDRADFLPDEAKEMAYVNEALPIGYKQTISQPLVVAFMLELLEIKPGEKVLEIGTGSGWKTSLMADLITESGNLVSIERIGELHKMAEKNLTKAGVIGRGNVKLVLGDGSQGYFEKAPFDKITAAASASLLPEVWKEQLKIGGKIVAPVKDSIVVLEKKSKDSFEIKEYFGFNFVPLIKG